MLSLLSCQVYAKTPEPPEARATETIESSASPSHSTEGDAEMSPPSSGTTATVTVSVLVQLFSSVPVRM